MTNAERWSEVKAWLDRALEQPEADRASWMGSQPIDAGVRAEVLSLLDSSARAGDFLEGSPLDLPGAAEALRDATEAFADAPLTAGYRLGPYQILRAIGEGGMGTVYLAARADDAFEKHVAIKLVRFGGSSRVLADRLRQERRVLAVLEHPNIARLLDGGTTPSGVPYVVMEHVEGEPIDTFCETNDLSVADRVRLVQGVCQAVHHAHAHLIVHRDIKAKNILVTKSGQPKLLDFGIAKVLAEQPLHAAVTAVYAMTPESASPEQLRQGVVTVASDIYGLGVLLYRLLTGQPPYPPSASLVEMLATIETSDPSAPSVTAPPKRRRRIGRDLDLIVLKALRREPERRYESAAAMADDLERWLTQRPVRAAPDSTSYQLRRFIGRHRLGVAAGVAALLALSIGMATAFWQFRVAEAERARAERRFNDVRRLASTVIFDLHDAIAPLPGSTEARRVLIQRALSYLDGLAAEAAEDLPLQRELALAYERLATVQGRPGNANLGDRDGARASLDKAIAGLERIVRDPGAAADDRVALARLYNQRTQLDTDRAARLQHIEAGLSMLDSLAPADQQRRQALAVRASLLFADAGVRVGSKEYDGAKATYQQVVALFQQLFETSDPPNWMESSRNLSIGHKSYGSVLWVMGDHEGAIDQYERAERLDRNRADQAPDNTTWKLDLSYSLASLAFAEVRSGREDEGLRHYQQSLELREAVLKVDPVNDQAQDAVARAHETLAFTWKQRGDFTRALESGLRAVGWRERRLTARPGDAELRDQLIVSLSTVYDVRLEMAKAASPQQARRDWQLARATIERVAQLQDEAIRGGTTTPAGPDRSAVAREMAKCDAALARLGHAS
jgi:non-specific serine/threonine protein kinase/serine/threonine-protein kinase